ncbi:MAG: methyltransferase domain-containing protein [Gammaproteobacteria bacterium]|jgi:ubiquinone/menaquinone biosynthesis C-methylase UbiE
MGDETDRYQDKQTVAEYWDKHTDDTFTGDTYWLAHLHVCRRFHRKSVGGEENYHWVNFCSERFLRDANDKPAQRVLNIGCGEGELDRYLVSINAAESIDAIDIAPNRIRIAKENASHENCADRINYTVSDAESSAFPRSDYDAILFDSSLHHINNLEAVIERCRFSLKSNGVLIVNEYIGPNRYRFNDRELEAMRAVFQLIPEKYRVSHMEPDRGKVRKEMGFPDPLEVERVDPSEAIRSEDIVSAIRQFFNIEVFNPQGGSLLQFVLQGIIGNFRAGDGESERILDMLFAVEDALVDVGDIEPHFALIIARPKS